MYKVLKPFNLIAKNSLVKNVKGDEIELSKGQAKEAIKQRLVKAIKKTKQAKETKEGAIEIK